MPATAGTRSAAGTACAAAVLAVLVLAGGCVREPADSPLVPGLDLARVPLSPSLAPHVAAARRALASPPTRGPAAGLLARARELETAIQRPATRTAALDSLWRLWADEPRNVVWIELATRYRRFLARRDAFAPLLARLDSATAPGAFLRGRLARDRRLRRRWYRSAVRDTAGLPPAQRVILSLHLAGAERRVAGPDSTIARVLALVPLARRAAGPRLERRCWSRLARDLRRAGRDDDALHAAALAVALARRSGDPYDLLDERRRLASLLLSRHDPETALAQLTAALREAEALDYPWGRKKTLDDAAAICCELADYRRAARFDRQALACNLAEADSANVPRSLVSLAHDYLMLDRPDSAGACLARARRWVTAYGDPRDLAMLPVFESRYRFWTGDYAAADSLLALARHRLAALGMESRLADALLDQIRMGLETGRARPAYAAMRRLRKLLPALEDHSPNQNRRADLELLTAELLTRQGEYAAAAAALDRARAEIARRGGEGQPWQLDRCTGELALARGDTATARAAFTRCLERARREGHAERLTASRFLLGNLLLAEGRGGEVRRLFADLPPVGQHRTRLAARLLVAASLARDGRCHEAADSLRHLLRDCPPGTPVDLRARLHLELGRALAAVGRPRPARTHLERAVDLLHAERPGGPRTEVLRSFHGAALRDAAEALVGLALDVRGSADPGETARTTLLLAERCRWPADRFAAGRDTLSPADLSHVLDGPDPLLVFLVGRERSFVWSGGAGRPPALRPLPGRSRLRQLLEPVLADLARPGRPIDSTALRRLGALLLSPLDGTWPPGTALRIVPDDVLCGVPWSALPWPPGDGGETGVLLDRGPVVEAPGVAFLARRRGPPPAPATLSLLAVGRDAGGEAGPHLHQAEAEARAVATLWPAGAATVLAGPAADWTRGVLPRLPTCGVLHLATHTVLHHGGAGRTTLRLGDDPAASPLTAAEAARLHLDAALVFLSCCEAAGTRGGAGLNDFARAFLGAGAGTVIAATQRLDDAAARYVATRFYRHWLSGGGRAAALRQALQDLREARPAWRHPYYWAGYHLLGDER